MINKVILVGNVGADPEVRTLESGVKTARVRLATSERYYNRETQQATEHTEWHTITLWRNLADVVDRFVRKGSQIYIEGRLRTREWTDQTGNKRYTTEVVVDEAMFVDSRNESGAPAAGYTPDAYTAPSFATPAAAAPNFEEMKAEDDLPF
jgi:single-strand DNA-binding protein